MDIRARTVKFIPWIIAGIIGVVLLSVPILLSDYWIYLLALCLVYAYWGVAWNIVGGLGGLFCIAHPMFIAAGAYTVVFLGNHFDISPWLGMVVGALIAVLIALFTGWVTFRRKLPVLAFALVTLAFSFILLYIILGTKILGADEGLIIKTRGWSFLNFQFGSRLPYYYIVLVMTFGILAIYRYLERSKIGFYMRAIRDNELAAASIGIDIMKYKLIGLSISAALTAFGGSFLAQMLLFVNPHEFAGVLTIIKVILFTVVGGIGTLMGPVIGALIFVPLGELLKKVVGLEVLGLHGIIYGIALIVVVQFVPGGIAGILHEWWHKFSRRLLSGTKP